MLVLTRKIGEAIVIEGGITLTLLKVSRETVRIGIVAPPDVRIDREEVHRRKLQEGALEIEVPVS